MNNNSGSVDPPTIDTGDTAFLLASSALVMLMTPGLAFFYGGLVRMKNMINTMMMSFITLGIITIHWVVFGYSFSFGGGNIFYGSGDWVGLKGVSLTDPNPIYAATIPHTLFMVYQMMFAIITPAIISGAVVERMSFRAYCIFLLCWTTLCYDMVAHWIWSAWEEIDAVTGEVVLKFGWARALGALDFAGGTVVHISSGVSALVAAIIVGRRPDAPELSRPANTTHVLLGGALLWFGWFGFNGGSALSAGALASIAFINTQIATGTAFTAWILMDVIFKKKATAVGAIEGAVIGLVAITPAAGFVHPQSSIAIGGITSILCYLIVMSKEKFAPRIFPQLDDTLDVFTCHGMGGIIGAILTGFFASKDVNPYGADGVFFNNPILLGYQLAAIAATILCAVVVTSAILLPLKYTIGLTVSDNHIEHGIDSKTHGSAAIELDVVTSLEENTTSVSIPTAITAEK